MIALKIVLITQGVSRVVQPLLNSKHDLVGVIESATRDAIKRKEPNYLYKIARQLYSLVKKQEKTLKSLSDDKKIPYRYMLSSSDEGLEQWLKSLQPDLIVVFSMSQLLKENIFTIPRLGTVNMHAAMLPDYRGPNPDVWQYINLEMNPGVTIHYIDKGEDTGDILNQERVNIPLGTKSSDRLNKLIGKVGVRNLLKTIDELAGNIANPIKQPQQSPTKRARKINPEEHKKIIDWQNWETSHIWHVLRGTELWLNALEQPKGFYKGQRWSVGNYKILDEQTKPLETIYKNGKNYAVATKDGYIELNLNFSIKKLLLAVIK
ncbi:methionyl-tRNA formyltransferase [Oceanisphaera sp. KMM 10153]|uniref:methionyl-tRNA formyltransferase n=1 Tax=Oceanisphaera submarina TaxID=3390193 RepID=UPI0039749A58